MLLMNILPKVGSTIRVEVKNFSATLLNPIFKGLVPETLVYEGTVVPNNKWDNPDTFSLTSDDPYFPVRNIAMKNVISIDGSNIVHNVQTSVRVEQVVGSKGNVYTVVIDGNKATCTYPQNQFKKQVCKHIKKVLGIENETSISKEPKAVPSKPVTKVSDKGRTPVAEADKSSSKITQAREIYVAVGGERSHFIDLVQRNLGMTVSGANTYFYKIRNEQ